MHGVAAPEAVGELLGGSKVAGDAGAGAGAAAATSAVTPAGSSAYLTLFFGFKLPFETTGMLTIPAPALPLLRDCAAAAACASSAAAPVMLVDSVCQR